MSRSPLKVVAPYAKLKLDALHRQLAPGRGIGVAPAPPSGVRPRAPTFPLTPQPTTLLGTLKALLKKLFITMYVATTLWRPLTRDADTPP